ncbi:MAG: hypothetical protein QW569_00315 [Candidatus Bathyarchaeia archaeon]
MGWGCPAALGGSSAFEAGLSIAVQLLCVQARAYAVALTPPSSGLAVPPV